MLIDTHCHLTSPEFGGRVAEVLVAAREAGVTRVIHVATDPADAEAGLRLLREHDNLYLVLGIHPHEAARYDLADVARFEPLLRGAGAAAGLADRVVGIGETGLDFHYDFAPHARQEELFRAHLELALRTGRPIVIHARESEPRVCDILAEYPTLAGRVVFHCFSGDVDLARRALDLGCFCSFTGVVTFKKAAPIQAAARYLPLDRIMLETDAPWLSPEPLRKVRPNAPALLVHTARFVAALRGLPLADLAAATTANAERFFALRKD